MVGLGATKRTASLSPRSSIRARTRATLGLAVGPAGPAHHDQQGVGVAAPHLGEGTDGDVEGLQRLDAPDEQQRGPARLEPQGGAGADRVAGREEGVEHAGRHQLDAAGSAP